MNEQIPTKFEKYILGNPERISSIIVNCELVEEIRCLQKYLILIYLTKIRRV